MRGEKNQRKLIFERDVKFPRVLKEIFTDALLEKERNELVQIPFSRSFYRAGRTERNKRFTGSRNVVSRVVLVSHV